MEMEPSLHLIGDLAKAAGVKADTIRFYEKRKLLPKPERSAAGYRIYDSAAADRVQFIKKAQALGFSLQEIRRILDLRAQDKPACDCVIAIAAATLAETDRKLDQLQRFRDALRRNLDRWRRERARTPNMAAAFCALIESTALNASNAHNKTGVSKSRTRQRALRRQRL